MNQYAELLDLTDVDTLTGLLRAVREGGDEAYEQGNGSYSDLPTWGPETDRVQALVDSSGPEGDLVSWDTRSPDVSKHRYLRRHVSSGQNEWQIYTEADMVDLYAVTDD